MGSIDIVIKDLGSCISIMRNEVPLLVVKAHIKTIDTVGQDAVRLNVGEGPLRNIYLNVQEVAEPKTLDVSDLVNQIYKMIEKSAA